jgi:hypothetical protein
MSLKFKILNMKTTLKYKINIFRQYLRYYIFLLKPSAGLPSLMRPSLYTLVKYSNNSEQLLESLLTFVHKACHPFPPDSTVYQNSKNMAHISGDQSPGLTQASPPTFVILKGG